MSFRKPRRVMPVPPGTEVHFLGQTLCLQYADLSILSCVSGTPLREQGLTARLPTGTQPFVSVEALLNPRE